MANTDDNSTLGPTGAICRDLPSPYLPDPETGLLHLPRFLAKIRKSLAGELPKSYQRNFSRGFDRFLCMHLGIEPEAVVEAVREYGHEEGALRRRLREIFPADCQPAKWNRQLVQIGMSEMGRENLQASLRKMGLEHRQDILSFADMIELDEGRIEGYDPREAIAKGLRPE